MLRYAGTRRTTLMGQPPVGRSRSRLPEHLVDALAEPLEAVRLDRLGQPGPHDQHVVVRGRHGFEPGAPDLSQLPLNPAARRRAADRARDAEAEPRLTGLLLRKPVEDEVAS